MFFTLTSTLVSYASESMLSSRMQHPRRSKFFSPVSLSRGEIRVSISFLFARG